MVCSVKLPTSTSVGRKKTVVAAWRNLFPCLHDDKQILHFDLLTGFDEDLRHFTVHVPEPFRQTVMSDGEEREYFVRLPANFDPTKQYWLLAVIHGGRGNGRQEHLGRYWPGVQEKGLNAILVTSSMRSPESGGSFAFPSQGEGRILVKMIEKLRATYQLRPRILLAGFSGGGNFVHRYPLFAANLKMWQGRRDSNPHLRFWRPLVYR